MIDTTTGWLVIAGVAVLLFGSASLSKWAKAIGEAKREYEKSSKGQPESEKA